MAQFVNIDDQLQHVLLMADAYKEQGPDSRDNLVEALTALQRHVEGPPAYLSRIRLSPLLNMCIIIAMELGVLRTIVQHEDRSIEAGQLASLCRQRESIIVRIMRLLTVNGICDEVARKTYCSNATAAMLATPEQIGATWNTVDLMFPIGGKLVSQLRQPEGLSQFKDSDSDVTPFRAVYGKSMFEYFETNQEHKEAFDLFMAGRRRGIRRMWCDYYPLSERLLQGASQSPESVFMVDIGGGKGHDIIDLRQKQPNARGRLILQDLPLTLKGIDLTASGVEVIHHNFFEPQPVQGARAYYFRSIFHDWSDSKSKQILLHTVRAMKRGYSRIIIEDLVLPDMHASWRASSIDVLMFMMPEGVERSRDQWEHLLASAGLKISGIWYGGDGAESTIEAVLQDEPDVAGV